ncbi:unnamed protein product [Dicrocoelium dendriticum]|nr:unnamed protein product [Dicrocoelium dendriticum]
MAIYFCCILTLQEEMSLYSDKRKALADSQAAFQSRRGNFNRFILDNLNKQWRQRRAIKESRIMQEQGMRELQFIGQQTEEALKRRDQLQRKLTTLRHYESLLRDALDLLPKDYFRANTNGPDSLILRFTMLQRMQKLLLSELYQKQESVQKEFSELNQSRMEQVEDLLTKIGSMQLLGNEWNQELENRQKCEEQYERDRDRVAEECVRFVTIVRALRNIAEKAASGLYSLHTQQVSNQHKVPLQINFRVILRFLNVVTAIREEIAPATKKQRPLVETKRNDTPISLMVSRKTTLSDTTTRDNKPSNVGNWRILPLFSSHKKGIDDTDGE